VVQQSTQFMSGCDVHWTSGPPQTPLMHATPLQHSWLSVQLAPTLPQAAQLPT
jgi:hypothetical protein